MYFHIPNYCSFLFQQIFHLMFFFFFLKEKKLQLMMSPHSHEVKFNTSFLLSTEYWDRISRREIRRDFRDWQRSGRERERERRREREEEESQKT